MGIEGLDFRVVDVRFTEGLDTRTQPKLVVPGKWALLDNLTLSANNTPQRRDGISALVAAANGNGLALHKDELLTVNGPTLSTVASGVQAKPGVVGWVGVSKTPVFASTGFVDSVDTAFSGGLVCTVWREYSSAVAVQGINCSVTDSRGAKLLDNAVVVANAGAVTPRVVASGGAFFIFYIVGTSLFCRVIDATAPTTMGAAVALVTSAFLSPKNIDACAFNDGSGNATAWAAYVWTDGFLSTQSINVARTGTVPALAFGPTPHTTEAAIPNATIQGLSCCAFGSGTSAVLGILKTAGGAAVDGTYIYEVTPTLAPIGGLLSIDPTLAPVASPAHIVACPVSTTGMAIYTDQQSSYGTANFRPVRATLISAGGGGAIIGPLTALNSATFRINNAEASGPQGPFIAGKPFVSNGHQFLPMCVLEDFNVSQLNANTSTRSAQCTFFLYDITLSASTTAFPVARALYGTLGLLDPTLGGAAPTVSTPCSTPLDLSGRALLAQQERGALRLVNGVNVTPVGVCLLTLTPSSVFGQSPVHAELGPSTFFAGGNLTSYDGSRIDDHGFPMFPEGISAVRNAAAGAGLTVGVHQIVAVYEWMDENGLRHQSAPSLPVSVTITVATDTITVIIPALLTAPLRTNITIGLYMTLAGGLTFFRIVDSLAASALVNTTAASTVTVTLGNIVSTDTVLGGNEVLYTQPNIANSTLPNVSPGPCTVLTVAQNRIWKDESDNPFRFSFSQEFTTGVGLQFNPALGGYLPADSGGFMGMAPLDEKVIIFAKKKPYVVYGTGPTPSGGFSNYSPPQEIASDVGCSDTRSILRMPQGIIFKSQKGWHLLGRDLTVTYIGEGVAAYDAYSVNAATLLEDRKECRFVLAGGPQLVFSYLIGQWSTFTVTGTTYNIADAAWWSSLGRYVTISTDKGLNQDVANLLTDTVGSSGPFGFNTTGRTSWLRLANLNGFQRVSWLYLTATNTGVQPTSTLSIAVDFDDGYGGVAPGAYTDAVPLSGVTFVNGMPTDVRHKLRRQKCKSVAFTFTETATSSQIPLLGLQGLSLLVGLKKGLKKLPAAQSV